MASAVGAQDSRIQGLTGLCLHVRPRLRSKLAQNVDTRRKGVEVEEASRVDNRGLLQAANPDASARFRPTHDRCGRGQVNRSKIRYASLRRDLDDRDHSTLSCFQTPAP
ncbi:MAG: hypothetical protein AAB214_22010 [Fibrobacterota bacterium]